MSEQPLESLNSITSDFGSLIFVSSPVKRLVATDLDDYAIGRAKETLKEFDGTLLFVSHDRYFIRALAGKILELEDGNALSFTGNYDEYTAYKNNLKMAKAEAQRVPAPTVSKNTEQKDGYYRSKEERAADAKRRTRVKKIEDEIAALEMDDEEINASLSDPSTSYFI